ncbi:MAG: acyl-CoA dehydrogenase family protein [Promethearchaeota archaeon]|jgi:acyl-CoA dehydrogenase
MIEFTEEQELIRQSVSEFAQKKIAPIALDMEKNKEIPQDVIKGMAELGLLGCTANPSYGGSGLDAVTAGVIAEELAKGDCTGSTCVFYLVQASWGYLLNKYGTEEAKKEIFPKVTSGDWFLGIATTESGGGTDVVGGKTTIKKEGDDFIVNGEKMYISGVREAVNGGGGHVTIGHQSPELGSRGMTVFYLPLTAEGITPTYIDDLGREGISCGGFSIDNVKIPKKYIIGEENKGFYIIHEGYEYARALIAVICAAAGLKSLENGMNYVKERTVFGKPLAKFQEINFRLAEHYTKLEMLKSLGYEALRAIDLEQEGKGDRFETSKIVAMSKMFASDWACEAINDVIQWQGAFGYSRECPDQAAWRAVRSFSLAEGTREVMKMIVARELLGKELTSYK